MSREAETIPQETRQRPGKRSGSLVWRLTFNQAVRSFFGIVSLNIAILLLFFCGLAAYTEISAADAVPYLSGDAPPEIPIGAEYSFSGEPPQGVPIRKLERLLPIYPDTRRTVYGEPMESLVDTLWTLRYTVSIPLETGRTLVLTYSWGGQAIVFFNCFLVLQGMELFHWIGSVSKVRRSVRRTLRPIYELTRTAQTIRTEPGPAPSPRSEDLHLSGAIETLNTITENRLDTRIVIGDEREELRGLAAAINGMLDRLDAAYQSQLRFVSDASHELRTPIAVIQGYANLLSRWGKDDEKTLQESIEAIKSEAQGMQDLVEQLLFLARSDNDSITMGTEAIDLSALAAEVLAETKMIDPHHLFRGSFGPPLPISGDPQLLKQALRIFVDNSIKYTPAGEEIVLATRLDGERAAVSVTDNGIGIPAEELPHVFDRFFRADESRTRETGGTGLGLSIARWIVDRHGGYAELISRKEIGTRITVYLPLCGQTNQNPDARS